jgi:formimidoylglutamase
LNDIPYLRRVSILKQPALDPNITRLGQITGNWDGVEYVDAGIVGIPFDRSVDHDHRRGASLGPGQIRDELYTKSTYYIDHDTDVGHLKMVDCGDVEVTIDYGETHRRVEAALTPIFGSGMTPVIIGGDHSVTYPCIKALCNSLDQRKKLGVIDLDAHHDCRQGLEKVSGLWAREIQEMENAPVKGENIVQIGIHGSNYSRFYRDYVERTGITVYTPMEIRRRGIEVITEEAIEKASNGVDALYLSVDIDVLDQTFAPGTVAPTPGGLTPWDVTECIFRASGHPLVCALDVMEVAPPLDVNDMTSKNAADIIMNFLCGLSIKKA